MAENDRVVGAPVGDYAASSDGTSSDGVVKLTHTEVRGLLSDYLDGQLSRAEREHVGEHLAQCQSCRAFFKTLAQTVERLGQQPRPRLSDRAKRQIVDQLRTTATPS